MRTSSVPLGSGNILLDLMMVAKRKKKCSSALLRVEKMHKCTSRHPNAHGNYFRA
jgi:hypothetical protein